MFNSKFSNVKLKGVVTVIPKRKICIDDEIKYFENDKKKLERAKKIIGYGDRYVVDKNITVVDLTEYAAKILLKELSIEKSSIDGLILVTQSPDYLYPASSCILHGRLGLSESCASFDINLGCSGYVYGIWMAHSLISSGANKRILLLAGDDPSTHSNVANRLSNPLFGDAASASLLEYTDQDTQSYFSLGSRGSGWDKIIAPATGRRLPVRKDIVDLEIKDKNSNIWFLYDEIIKGVDVFNFSLEVAPKNIHNLLSFANKRIEDIDYFAIHQANKQIVQHIISKANIPQNRTTYDTFTKYGNNSTNSVVTVLCDKLQDRYYNDIMLTTFGVGLSWGSAIININNINNLGIRIFDKKPEKNREDEIKEWINYFKGD